MKTMDDRGSVLGLIATLTLGACATVSNSPNAASNYGIAKPGNAYSEYSVVHSIELLKQDDGGIAGGGIGLGTIADGVVGGIVGHQVGSGPGNTAATVIGAAGGAYVGHELESRHEQQAEAYKVTVRMEDGSYQALMQSTSAGFRVGDWVRVGSGILQRY